MRKFIMLVAFTLTSLMASAAVTSAYPPPDCSPTDSSCSVR